MNLDQTAKMQARRRNKSLGYPRAVQAPTLTGIHGMLSRGNHPGSARTHANLTMSSADPGYRDDLEGLAKEYLARDFDGTASPR